MEKLHFQNSRDRSTAVIYMSSVCLTEFQVSSTLFDQKKHFYHFLSLSSCTYIKLLRRGRSFPPSPQPLQQMKPCVMRDRISVTFQNDYLIVFKWLNDLIQLQWVLHVGKRAERWHAVWHTSHEQTNGEICNVQLTSEYVL